MVVTVVTMLAYCLRRLGGDSASPVRFHHWNSLSMNWPKDTCDHYWEHADWLPPWYILDRWCQRDDRYRQAKYEALLTACERGDVKYGRRDGKGFDDPVRELAERRILTIERISFDAWAIRLEGQSPLAAPPRPMAPSRQCPPGQSPRSPRHHQVLPWLMLTTGRPSMKHRSKNLSVIRMSIRLNPTLRPRFRKSSRQLTSRSSASAGAKAMPI